MAATAIRAFAEEVLQRPEFAHMDTATKATVAQKLVRISDPTDPRNLLTAVLLNLALIYETHAAPHPPPPSTIRAPLAAIAAMPAFQGFAESVAGPAGILAATGGVRAARAELFEAIRDGRPFEIPQ